MKRSRRSTKPALPRLTHKTIRYHFNLDNEFQTWAEVTSWDPQRLRQATATALTTRHQEAFIDHESNRACGNRPDIFTLRIASMNVIYTVEHDIVVVRGYSWDINLDPDDDMDGGGFYCEISWSDNR